MLPNLNGNPTPTVRDTEKEPNKITNAVRQEWNNFVDFLDQRGLKGNPELDKGDLSQRLLSQYIRENPMTPLRPEMVKDIQGDFANYRGYALNKIRQNKGVLAPGVTEENFMADLSKLDNWPGSFTTKHKFPMEYLQHLDTQGNVERTQNLGFAVPK